MTADDSSDVDAIRRERERRRSEELSRIERVRHDRELELARLRRADLLQSAEEPAESPAEEPETPSESREPAADSVSAAPRARRVSEPPPPKTARRAARTEPPEGTAHTASLHIGHAVHSAVLEQFFALDSTQKFDLLQLNSLPYPTLLAEAVRDPEVAKPLRRRAESLMERVKKELDDPLSAGAFLREQVLTWYRSSADTPDWVDRMAPRWSGLFAESHVTGGRIQSWLNHRLSIVYDTASQSGRLGSRIRQGLRRAGQAAAAVVRTTMQQIQAESAQAILDDLAARPRSGDAPFPLVRLSELAVRRQVQTINDALSVLFNSHETGPFIILHPNRYPDCDEVQIRPPVGAATGAALAFVMVTTKAGRRGAGHAAVGGEGSPTPEGEEGEYDGTTIWTGSSISAKTWPALVESYRAEKKRLEAPPKDYRNRPAYAALRDVLLDDAEFRKAFLSVKWRGRPAGLPLLVGLLNKGALAPEVATDFEYLEAELGALAADDPAWRPEGGTWKFRSWTVTREGDATQGVRYKAEREGASPVPPP